MKEVLRITSTLDCQIVKRRSIQLMEIQVGIFWDTGCMDYSCLGYKIPFLQKKKSVTAFYLSVLGIYLSTIYSIVQLRWT